LKEGPVNLSADYFAYFGQKLDLFRRMPLHDTTEGWASLQRSLELFVGNDEVKGRFSKDAMGLPYLDLSYVDALQLLGLEIPYNFRQSYDEAVRKKKYEIARRLLRLVEQEKSLDKRIETVYSAIRTGTMIEGGGITVVEDEDDAKVVTLGDKMRVREIENEIRSTLKKALKLKMNQDSIEIGEILPGISIRMDQLITGLSKAYNVSAEEVQQEVQQEVQN